MKLAELVEIVRRGEPCKASSLEGVLSANDLSELLEAAPSGEGSLKELVKADFRGVIFSKSIKIDGIRFVGNADFTGAIFQGDAIFVRIEGKDCCFARTTFASVAHLEKWEAQDVLMDYAVFHKPAFFAYINAVKFSFSHASFLDRTMFFDLKITSFLLLHHSVFKQRVGDFVAGCKKLVMNGARLEAGGVLYLHGGVIDLNAVEFLSSTIISGTTKSGQFHNLGKSLIVGDGDWKPRVFSVEGTDLEKVIFQDVNLAHCYFDGAINLDKLRLDGVCIFDKPPKGLITELMPPFIWFWTNRQTVFEERIWRSHSPRSQGWRLVPRKSKQGEPVQVDTRGNPFSGSASTTLQRRSDAERLAKVYRALRKGREEAKNEPGAGDFYYGEMEMRRAGIAGLGERAVIWLYWALSGYGQRPLRTFLSLMLVLVSASFMLFHFGFVTQISYPLTLLATLAAAVNIEYVESATFTLLGQWVRILVKVLCPTLFAGLLLSLWGRVKR